MNQEEIEHNEMSNNNTRQKKCARQHRVDAIKIKGEIEEVKDECAVRLFSVNYNGLGPQSSGKLEKIKKERDDKNRWHDD